MKYRVQKLDILKTDAYMCLHHEHFEQTEKESKDSLQKLIMSSNSNQGVSAAKPFLSQIALRAALPRRIA